MEATLDYEENTMIICRTPLRISLFGGGTDYSEWFKENGGAVISTTIDKYNYISCRELPPFFDHKYRVSYSVVEHVNNVEQIQNRAIRAVLETFATNLKGLEINCAADLPSRSGLGSSSSFVVSLLQAIKTLQGVSVDKKWLAENAIHIEQTVLDEVVGSQDQVATAFGGFNKIEFCRNGDFTIDSVKINQDRKTELNNHLMLFFTGFSRIASEIASSQVKNFGKKVKELNEIYRMVEEANEVLETDCDIRLIGEMLDRGWNLKSKLSEMVTNSYLDSLYAKAKKAGAIGGKVLGAGGGGFMLFFVEPEKQDLVRNALSDLINVPFKFEDSGSQVIVKN